MKSTDGQASKAVEALSRVGYAAKGIVYVLVGVLAALAAADFGGRTTGTKGAILQLSAQPYGQIMLGAMALGLGGHVLWRFTQGFADPERKGNDLKGLMSRGGLILSGLIYAALAVYTVDLLTSAGSDGGGGSAEDRTATLMSYEGGIWLVGAIGLGFIGVGLYQAWRAYSMAFKKRWHTAAMGCQEEIWVTRIARVGLSARATVFVIIGGFLVLAAVQTDPDEAKGLGGALQTVARQPFGQALLGLVALGLICYGLYCFVNARSRHINS